MDTLKWRAQFLPVNYLSKQESRCERKLVKVLHRRRWVWDKEERGMEWMLRLGQLSKHWFYPSCTLFWQKSPSPSFKSLFPTCPVCATGSQHERWSHDRRHSAFWRALCENESCIFNAALNERGWACDLFIGISASRSLRYFSHAAAVLCFDSRLILHAGRSHAPLLCRVAVNSEKRWW